MTDEQLLEIRTLLQTNGYLPYSNKSLRLLEEAERLQNRDPSFVSAIHELREKLQTNGYLPFTKAVELLDMVERLRMF